MLPVLEFVFQDGWHFLGTVILLSIVGEIFGAAMAFILAVVRR